MAGFDLKSKVQSALSGGVVKQIISGVKNELKEGPQQGADHGGQQTGGSQPHIEQNIYVTDTPSGPDMTGIAEVVAGAADIANTFRSGLSDLLRITNNEIKATSAFAELTRTYAQLNQPMQPGSQRRGPKPGMAALNDTMEAVEHRSAFRAHIQKRMTGMREDHIGGLLTSEGKWNEFATGLLDRAREAENATNMQGFLTSARAVISALNDRQKKWKKSEIDPNSKPGVMNGGRRSGRKPQKAQQTLDRIDKQADKELQEVDDKKKHTAKELSDTEVDAAKAEAASDEKKAKTRQKNRKKVKEANIDADKAEAEADTERSNEAVRNAKQEAGKARKKTEEDELFGDMKARDFRKQDGRFDTKKIRSKLKEKNGGKDPNNLDVYRAQAYMEENPEGYDEGPAAQKEPAKPKEKKPTPVNPTETAAVTQANKQKQVSEDKEQKAREKAAKNEAQAAAKEARDIQHIIDQESRATRKNTDEPEPPAEEEEKPYEPEDWKPVVVKTPKKKTEAELIAERRKQRSGAPMFDMSGKEIHYSGVKWSDRESGKGEDQLYKGLKYEDFVSKQPDGSVRIDTRKLHSALGRNVESYKVSDQDVENAAFNLRWLSEHPEEQVAEAVERAVTQAPKKTEADERFGWLRPDAMGLRKGKKSFDRDKVREALRKNGVLQSASDVDDAIEYMRKHPNGYEPPKPAAPAKPAGPVSGGAPEKRAVTSEDILKQWSADDVFNVKRQNAQFLLDTMSDDEDAVAKALQSVGETPESARGLIASAVAEREAKAAAQRAAEQAQVDAKAAAKRALEQRKAIIEKNFDPLKKRDPQDYVDLEGNLSAAKIRSALTQEIGVEPTEDEVNFVLGQLRKNYTKPEITHLQPEKTELEKTNEQIENQFRKLERLESGQVTGKMLRKAQGALSEEQGGGDVPLGMVEEAAESMIPGEVEKTKHKLQNLMGKAARLMTDNPKKPAKKPGEKKSKAKEKAGEQSDQTEEPLSEEQKEINAILKRLPNLRAPAKIEAALSRLDELDHEKAEEVRSSRAAAAAEENQAKVKELVEAYRGGRYYTEQGRETLNNRLRDLGVDPEEVLKGVEQVRREKKPAEKPAKPEDTGKTKPKGGKTKATKEAAPEAKPAAKGGKKSSAKTGSQKAGGGKKTQEPAEQPVSENQKKIDKLLERLPKLKNQDKIDATLNELEELGYPQAGDLRSSMQASTAAANQAKAAEMIEAYRTRQKYTSKNGKKQLKQNLRSLGIDPKEALKGVKQIPRGEQKAAEKPAEAKTAGRGKTTAETPVSENQKKIDTLLERLPKLRSQEKIDATLNELEELGYPQAGELRSSMAATTAEANQAKAAEMIEAYRTRQKYTSKNGKKQLRKNLRELGLDPTEALKGVKQVPRSEQKAEEKPAEARGAGKGRTTAEGAVSEKQQAIENSLARLSRLKNPEKIAEELGKLDALDHEKAEELRRSIEATTAEDNQRRAAELIKKYRNGAYSSKKGRQSLNQQLRKLGVNPKEALKGVERIPKEERKAEEKPAEAQKPSGEPVSANQKRIDTLLEKLPKLRNQEKIDATLHELEELGYGQAGELRSGMEAANTENNQKRVAELIDRYRNGAYSSKRGKRSLNQQLRKLGVNPKEALKGVERIPKGQRQTEEKPAAAQSTSGQPVSDKQQKLDRLLEKLPKLRNQEKIDATLKEIAELDPEKAGELRSSMEAAAVEANQAKAAELVEAYRTGEKYTSRNGKKALKQRLRELGVDPAEALKGVRQERKTNEGPAAKQEEAKPAETGARQEQKPKKSGSSAKKQTVKQEKAQKAATDAQNRQTEAVEKLADAQNQGAQAVDQQTQAVQEAAQSQTPTPGPGMYRVPIYGQDGSIIDYIEPTYPRHPRMPAPEAFQPENVSIQTDGQVNIGGEGGQPGPHTPHVIPYIPYTPSEPGVPVYNPNPYAPYAPRRPIYDLYGNDISGRFAPYGPEPPMHTPPVEQPAEPEDAVRWFDSLGEYTQYLSERGLDDAAKQVQDRLTELGNADVTGIQATFNGTQISGAKITAEHVVNGERKGASISQAFGMIAEDPGDKDSPKHFGLLYTDAMTDSDMSDRDWIKAQQDMFALRSRKNREDLERQGQRAGGIQTGGWTQEQINLLASAGEHNRQAAELAQSGQFKEAGTEMRDFSIEMQRLKSSLSETEKTTREAADTQKKFDQEVQQANQAVDQAVADKNYQRVPDSMRSDMEAAAATLSTDQTEDNLGALQGAVTRVQDALKVISDLDEAAGQSQALEKFKTETERLSGRNNGVANWTQAQQTAMAQIQAMQTQMETAMGAGDRGMAEIMSGNIKDAQSELGKSLTQSGKLISEYKKTIGSELFGGVGEELQTQLHDAFEGMMSDGSVSSMNAMAEALGRVRDSMTDIQQNDVFRDQEEKLNTLTSKLNTMAGTNGGYSHWTESQQAQFQNMQMTWAAMTQMHGGNVETGMILPGGGIMTQEMMDNLPNFGTFGMGMQAFNQQSQQLNNNFRLIGQSAGSVDTQVDALSRHLANMAAPMMMWRRFSSYMKQAAQNVAAIDTQMADLKKVTHNTSAEYDQFLTSTGRNAVAIGARISDLVQTTSTFAHMGYSLTDSQALGVTATKFANVGNFQNTNDAADAMIAVIKGFDELNIGDADLVGDKLTAVANNYAVTANDIAEGLQKSASSLNVAGNNVDQSAAMITAIAEVTRDAGAAGSALKVLSMRIRGAKAEIESTGESTDGMADSTSKLRKQVKALTNVRGNGGVDIMADEDTFRSTYDIMSDIADVWSEMSDIDQSALLELLAGKVRSNQVAALLSNFKQAEKAMETSQNAEGTMNKVHQAWMDSVDARKAQFQAAQETLSMTAMPADTLKGLYQAGTTGLGALNWLMGGMFGTGAGSGGVAAGIMSVATALRSGNGNIATGLGNILGLHRDTVNGGLTRGNAEWVGRYNEAFRTTQNKAEAYQIAMGDNAQALDGYTQKLYDNTDGLIDTTKLTSGLGNSLKSFAKNALVGVGTFAAIELAAVGLQAAWNWFDEDVLHKGETLANRAATAYAGYEQVQQQAKTNATEKETLQGQIDAMREKGASGELTTTEQARLADMESQMRTLEFTQRLLDMQARQTAQETFKSYRKSAGYAAKNQGDTGGLFTTDAFTDIFDILAKASSDASEAMKSATYGSADWDMAQGTHSVIGEAINAWGERSLYDTPEAFISAWGEELSQVGVDLTGGVVRSLGDRFTSRALEIAGTYGAADQNLGNAETVRGYAEAFAELQSGIAAGNLSPAAMAEAYTTAQKMYEKTQTAFNSLSEDAQKTLQDVGAVTGLETNMTSISSVAATAYTELQERAAMGLASWIGGGFTGDTSELMQDLSGLMTLGEAIDPGKKYDTIKSLLKGTVLEDAVKALDELAASAEVTSDDISGLETEKLKNAGSLLSNLLGMFGVSLSDFAGMVNGARQQADENTKNATAKRNAYEDRKTSVNSIINAQKTGAEVWTSSGYTGMMTEDDYKKMQDLNDQAYLAAVEYSHAGLFFNRDKFDQIVQQKYREELKGLQGDVIRETTKFNNAAEKILAKHGAGDTASQEFSNLLDEMITSGQNLEGYRRMAAQLATQTGEYANWINSKGGPESDDMYKELTSAIQLIEETKKTGRYGTREYAAALEFYSGQKGFTTDQLTSADWTHMALISGSKSQNDQVARHSVSTLQKNLKEAGVLGDDWGFTGAFTLDEVAQMYNDKFGTNIGAQHAQSIIEAINAYIENPDEKLQLGTPQTYAMPEEMSEAAKNLTAAMDAYKKDRTDENWEAVADAAKAYQKAASEENIKAMLEAGDVEGAAKAAAKQTEEEAASDLTESFASLNGIVSTLTKSMDTLNAKVNGEDTEGDKGGGKGGKDGEGDQGGAGGQEGDNKPKWTFSAKKSTGTGTPKGLKSDYDYLFDESGAGKTTVEATDALTGAIEDNTDAVTDSSEQQTDYSDEFDQRTKEAGAQSSANWYNNILPSLITGHATEGNKSIVDTADALLTSSAALADELGNDHPLTKAWDELADTLNSGVYTEQQLNELTSRLSQERYNLMMAQRAERQAAEDALKSDHTGSPTDEKIAELRAQAAEKAAAQARQEKLEKQQALATSRMDAMRESGAFGDAWDNADEKQRSALEEARDAAFEAIKNGNWTEFNRSFATLNSLMKQINESAEQTLVQTAEQAETNEPEAGAEEQVQEQVYVPLTTETQVSAEEEQAKAQALAAQAEQERIAAEQAVAEARAQAEERQRAEEELAKQRKAQEEQASVSVLLTEETQVSAEEEEAKAQALAAQAEQERIAAEQAAAEARAQEEERLRAEAERTRQLKEYADQEREERESRAQEDHENLLALQARERQQTLTNELQNVTQELQEAGVETDTATTNAIMQLEDANASGALITPEFRGLLQDDLGRLKAQLAELQAKAEEKNKQPAEDTTVSVPLTEETQVSADEEKAKAQALAAQAEQERIAAEQAVAEARAQAEERQRVEEELAKQRKAQEEQPSVYVPLTEETQVSAEEEEAKAQALAAQTAQELIAAEQAAAEEAWLASWGLSGKTGTLQEATDTVDVDAENVLVESSATELEAQSDLVPKASTILATKEKNPEYASILEEERAAEEASEEAAQKEGVYADLAAQAAARAEAERQKQMAAYANAGYDRQEQENRAKEDHAAAQAMQRRMMNSLIEAADEVYQGSTDEEFRTGLHDTVGAMENAAHAAEEAYQSGDASALATQSALYNQLYHTLQDMVNQAKASWQEGKKEYSEEEIDAMYDQADMLAGAIRDFVEENPDGNEELRNAGKALENAVTGLGGGLNPDALADLIQSAQEQLDQAQGGATRAPSTSKGKPSNLVGVLASAGAGDVPMGLGSLFSGEQAGMGYGDLPAHGRETNVTGPANMTATHAKYHGWPVGSSWMELLGQFNGADRRRATMFFELLQWLGDLNTEGNAFNAQMGAEIMSEHMGFTPEQIAHFNSQQLAAIWEYADRWRPNPPEYTKDSYWYKSGDEVVSTESEGMSERDVGEYLRGLIAAGASSTAELIEADRIENGGMGLIRDAHVPTDQFDFFGLQPWIADLFADDGAFAKTFETDWNEWLKSQAPAEEYVSGELGDYLAEPVYDSWFGNGIEITTSNVDVNGGVHSFDELGDYMEGLWASGVSTIEELMAYDNPANGGLGVITSASYETTPDASSAPDVTRQPVTIPSEIEPPEPVDVPEPETVVIPTQVQQPGPISVPTPPTVTIPVQYENPGDVPVNDDRVSLLKAAASGTGGASGGTYLVDEIGAELIEHRSRGTYELGTNTGARFTKLDPGDIVHTAKETKKILRRGNTMYRGGVVTGIAAVFQGDTGGVGTTPTVPGNSSKKVGDYDPEKEAAKAAKEAAAAELAALEALDVADHMAKNMLNWIKNILDWIPTYLNVLKKKTTQFVGAADDAVHYLASNRLLDGAIENIAEEIQANVSSVLRYRSFLQEIATRAGFDNDMVKLIQNGKIDLTRYGDERTVKAIQTYQQYWEKLVACQEALGTLNDQMETLAKQKLDNVVSYFDRIGSLLQDQQKKFESLIDLKKQYGQELKSEDYVNSVRTMEQILANAQEEQATLMKELEDQLGVGGDVVQAILNGGKAAWDEIAKHVKKGVDEGITDLQAGLDANIIEMTDYIGTNQYGQDVSDYYEPGQGRYPNEPTSVSQAANGAVNVTIPDNLPPAARAEIAKQIRASKVAHDINTAEIQAQKEASERENYEKLLQKNGTPLPDVTIPLFDTQAVETTEEDLIAIGEMLGMNVADGSEEALRNIEIIKSLLTTTWDNPLAVGSETWYQYMSTLEGLQESINQTKIDIGEMNDEIANIPLTNLKTGYDYLEEIRKNLEGVNSLADAQGVSKYPETFKSLISVGMRQIENLQEQNKLIEEQMSLLDPLSEKYQELRGDLTDNLESITNIRENQEEWNDAIIDLQIDRLKKQNDAYKEQLNLMKALDDLEKAKQRRLLIYREGTGFRYEADEDTLEAAQEAANDAVFSGIVSELERSKEDSNIYGPLGERLISGSSIVDSLGQTLVPVEDKLSTLDFEPYYQSILNGVEQSGLLTSMLNTIDMAKVLEQAIGGNVSIDLSGMTLNGVNDAKELGDAIIDQLPNYLLQALYHRGA